MCASRNLTRKFVDLRNASKANKSLKVHQNLRDTSDDSNSLLHTTESSNSTSWNKEKNVLPPVWVEKIESIEENIAKIQLKIRELAGLHTKRLMVNFEADEMQQEMDIDAKTREITVIFRNSEKLLGNFSKQIESATISPEEKKVRQNMQRSIGKKLQGLTISFRTTQKEYMTRLKGQKSGSGTLGLEFLGEKKSVSQFEMESHTDTGFTQGQLALLEDTEDLVNERDQEITHIAKSIEELATIFKELAVLVIDQGTILDRIDYNMETAVEHAKEGIQQLIKAEEHQKNAMPVKCIIVLVILIAIMLAILIWKHTDNSN